MVWRCQWCVRTGPGQPARTGKDLGRPAPPALVAGFFRVGRMGGPAAPECHKL
ncbi:hypothetical protein B0T16DRAFT_407883 [Cercophora newfieldiana]|uniref:Uncharacterized protein n=1 Tax=Cercophora newfieldiana TaxID=92897 RepID=A0AA40CSY2_9PEZI|nr:hypothetical protein B0T16DRAFT_407883 [Cercophora newfieldiana]